MNTDLDLVDGAVAKPKWIYWGAGTVCRHQQEAETLAGERRRNEL